jgi:hypothetical protein
VTAVTCIADANPTQRPRFRGAQHNGATTGAGGCGLICSGPRVGPPSEALSQTVFSRCVLSLSLSNAVRRFDSRSFSSGFARNV